VLKGKPKAIAPDDQDDPHLEVLLDAGGVSHRLAVNIRSGRPPYALLYKVVPDWDNHRIAALAALKPGRTRIADQPGLA
ncbi:DUF2278 family protein, partial [Mycobacterium tuberculosis]|nr:DUF2278 family protein [Mycobacterium tuberculosis]